MSGDEPKESMHLSQVTIRCADLNHCGLAVVNISGRERVIACGIVPVADCGLKDLLNRWESDPGVSR